MCTYLYWWGDHTHPPEHDRIEQSDTSMEFNYVRVLKRWKVNAYLFLNANNFWVETDINPLSALNVKTVKVKEVWNNKNAMKNCYWSPEWLLQNLSHWSYKRKISHVRRSILSIQLCFRILVLPELLCTIGSSIWSHVDTAALGASLCHATYYHGNFTVTLEFSVTSQASLSIGPVSLE